MSGIVMNAGISGINLVHLIGTLNITFPIIYFSIKITTFYLFGNILASVVLTMAIEVFTKSPHQKCFPRSCFKLIASSVML